MSLISAITRADLLPSPPLHKSAYSVVGGGLSIAVTCVAVVFVSYVLATRKVPVLTVSVTLQTGGDLYEAQLTNLSPDPANMTYTYPPGSPCHAAIAESSFAEVLAWTDSEPGVLAPNETRTVVLCQQRSLFRGLAAAEATMHGLSVLAIYQRVSNRWVSLVQPDGSTEYVSKLNFGFFVPVRLGRQQRRDVNGNVLSSRWLVNNMRGAAPRDPYCGSRLIPVSLACERFLLSVDDRFVDVVDVEADFKYLDFVFFVIFTVVLMYSVASLFKVLFRWSRRKYGWYRERRQGV